MICQTAARDRQSGPGRHRRRNLSVRFEGFLDSLGLVSVVLDVEQKVNDRYGLSISLADDRSVSTAEEPIPVGREFRRLHPDASAERQRG